MDAMILAGGMGSRLSPITDYIPKSLVPVDNVPLIEWQVRYLVRHQVRRIIVCAGHMHDQIENFVDARGGLGAEIKFSTETSPLGTGGAIKKAARLVRGDSALIINGDVITDIDLLQVASVKDSISAVELHTKYGVLDTDGDMVRAFGEKKNVRNVWMNAGVYHLGRKTMRAMPARGNAESTLFPKMAEAGSLHVVKFPKARWHSIDSHKDLAECTARVRSIVPHKTPP